MNAEERKRLQAGDEIRNYLGVKPEGEGNQASRYDIDWGKVIGAAPPQASLNLVEGALKEMDEVKDQRPEVTE
jgi:hypothetical protein